MTTTDTATLPAHLPSLVKILPVLLAMTDDEITTHSVHRLAEITEMAPRSASRARTELIELGIIETHYDRSAPTAERWKKRLNREKGEALLETLTGADDE